MLSIMTLLLYYNIFYVILSVIELHFLSDYVISFVDALNIDIIDVFVACVKGLIDFALSILILLISIYALHLLNKEMQKDILYEIPKHVK